MSDNWTWRREVKKPREEHRCAQCGCYIVGPAVRYFGVDGRTVLGTLWLHPICDERYPLGGRT